MGLTPYKYSRHQIKYYEDVITFLVYFLLTSPYSDLLLVPFMTN